MIFLENYKPLKRDLWLGRVDDPDDIDSYRWHQLIELIDLSAVRNEPVSGDTLGICFLGFCCDEGVERNLGRRGAAKGPLSIRKEMANLPRSFDRKTRIFDAGDIYCPKGDMETAQKELAFLVERMLSLNLFPVVLGGGHELAFGHYSGIIHSLSKSTGIPYPNTGIISLDAHFDLRPYNKGGNSGTMFLQIADECKEKGMGFSYFCLGIQRYGNTTSLFKKADELKVEYIMARDIDDTSMPGIMKRLDTFIDKRDHIYLTLCSDVFSAAFAPGVSAAQPFGLHPEIVLKMIKHILRSGKVVSFDIAEISPRFDEDNRTAKLAAIIIFALVNTLSE
jgi:formiminoglutamase